MYFSRRKIRLAKADLSLFLHNTLSQFLMHNNISMLFCRFRLNEHNSLRDLCRNKASTAMLKVMPWGMVEFFCQKMRKI
jgi:hypothetical protein